MAMRIYLVLYTAYQLLRLSSLRVISVVITLKPILDTLRCILSIAWRCSVVLLQPAQLNLQEKSTSSAAATMSGEHVGSTTMKLPGLGFLTYGITGRAH